MRLNGEISIAPGGANRILVQHQPIGVCGAGHALELPGRHGDPQDRAGARGRLHLVLKPATETPLTAYALAALYARPACRTASST